MNVPLRRYWSLLRTYLRPRRGRLALLTALLLVGVLVLLWREDARIGLAAALFAGAVLAAMLRLYALARPLWAATAQEGALFYGFVGERLAGMEDPRDNLTLYDPAIADARLLAAIDELGLGARHRRRQPRH